MATVQRAEGQDGTGMKMKRRGLIAGAAALVAGIAAKQAARPVMAASLNVVYSDDPGTVFLNSPASQVELIGQTTFGNPQVFYVESNKSTVDAIVGNALNGRYSVGRNGVIGQAASGSGVYGTSLTGNGVYGTSGGNHGVVGQTTGPPGLGYVGVYGYGNGSGTAGVLGDCTNGGATATGNAGVQGINAQYGVIGNTNNAANTIGVWGNNTSTGAGAIGVYGNAPNGIGVFGTTSAAGQFGVIGQTLVDNAFGLAGIANTNGSAAFAGGTANANAFAASFQGHVQVFDGAFDVFPMGNKHGLAQHPDGSVRTFYSVESPECWVEDFGKGTLTAGKAEIVLDKDFLALIHTDEYHVFLSEHGGHNGLHTTAKTASGFAVAASPHIAKVAGIGLDQVQGTFSWRVVAKPKTDAKVERLAKAKLAPKIDFTRLPKPPVSPPTPPTPAKKP